MGILRLCLENKTLPSLNRVRFADQRHPVSDNPFFETSKSKPHLLGIIYFQVNHSCLCEKDKTEKRWEATEGGA
jgi:hypothetical protein